MLDPYTLNVLTRTFLYAVVAVTVGLLVVVLHQGALLLDGSVEEVVASELVREVYAGDAHV